MCTQAHTRTQVARKSAHLSRGVQADDGRHLVDALVHAQAGRVEGVTNSAAAVHHLCGCRAPWARAVGEVGQGLVLRQGRAGADCCKAGR